MQNKNLHYISDMAYNKERILYDLNKFVAFSLNSQFYVIISQYPSSINLWSIVCSVLYRETYYFYVNKILIFTVISLAYSTRI